jgi:hypothetical protein
MSFLLYSVVESDAGRCAAADLISGVGFDEQNHGLDTFFARKNRRDDDVVLRMSD